MGEEKEIVPPVEANGVVRPEQKPAPDLADVFQQPSAGEVLGCGISMAGGFLVLVGVGSALGWDWSAGLVGVVLVVLGLLVAGAIR